jgi:hypothetical protein
MGDDFCGDIENQPILTKCPLLPTARRIAGLETVLPAAMR